MLLSVRSFMRDAGGTPLEPPEGVPGLPAPLQREVTDFFPSLDEPWSVEFATYVKNVATLDFGPSLVNRYRSVDDAVEEGFPVTVELILLAALWASRSASARLFAAVRRGGALDHLATWAASSCSCPRLLRDVRVSRYLVFEWDVFPLGVGHLAEHLLPVFALGLTPAGYVARLTRAAAVERFSRTTSARPRPRPAPAPGDRCPRPAELGRPTPLRHAADARAARHRRASSWRRPSACRGFRTSS